MSLPGKKFSERFANKTPFEISLNGDFLLSPGDYSIPVMTYCMRSSSSSPSGHVYSLDRTQGKLAPIIRKLNLNGPFSFPRSDLQIVHWSLQAGLSYDEMTDQSRQVIDQIIPEHKIDLKESFLSSVEQAWTRLSEETDGKILRMPAQRLAEMRVFKNKLREVGHDYERLSQLIETTSSLLKGSETSWSKISDNIYARFVTPGHFGQIGFVQIRVFPNAGRKINADVPELYSLDIASVLANPNDTAIQPLSLSPLYGVDGLVYLSQIATNPRAASLLIPLVLAAQPRDWDEFFELVELLDNGNDKDIQQAIRSGQQALRKEHDELEKPLREERIITGKSPGKSKEKSKKVRQYVKPGGLEQLEKDFNKISGEHSVSDEVEVKTLPDGTKIIKRPHGDKGPTLEVQPSEDSLRYPDPRIRIKVRYQ